jgi:hypothetical protein
MRNLRRILGLWAGVALLACLTPSIILAGAAKPRAERPTYTLGEKWLRDDGAYELIRIEDDRYIFAAGPGQEVHLTKDFVIARVQKGLMFAEFETPPALAWPLEVGKWGTGQGGAVRFHNKPLAASAHTLTWSVDAFEDVTVPAGTFKALRIVQTMAGAGSSISNIANLTAWYAPSLQQLVKLDATLGSNMTVAPNLFPFQLVAVDRPAPAPLQVVLQEPEDQARVTAARLPLKGQVTGGKGVARVTVTLNGREVGRHEAPPGAPPSEVSLDNLLPLQEGKNVLLVTATDPDGTTRQEARTIVYEPSAAVAGSRPAPAPSGAGPPSQTPRAPAAKPRAERPTYTLGEKWLRDDGAYELIRIEDDRYVFSAGPEKVVELTKDLAVAKVQRGQAKDEWSPPPALAWPLEVGKWGSSDNKWIDDFGPNHGRLVWSVEAYESVRVPAGTFQAFRIEIVVTAGLRANTSKLRLWYAPEARQYVKGELTGAVRQGVQTLHTFQSIALDRAAPGLLQVVLQEPEDQARVANAHLPLKGKVTGEKGVALVVITLNGRDVTRHEAPPGAPPTEVPLTTMLPLQAGENVLRITATDPAGTTRQESRTLFYDPPAAVAGSRPAPASSGTAAPSRTPRAPPNPAPSAPRTPSGRSGCGTTGPTS